MKKRVLSGIRATGKLHLGNYLGAIKGMLELQDSSEYETYYMVADVHTITTPYDPDNLRTSSREIIIDYLAAGLDPEKSILFQQSMVDEHLSLSFLFSSISTVARMQHLPTFKDKLRQHPENATMALLNYPILMASDILIYKAHLVPVGIDQEPHLEVAREIARKMSSKFKVDFPEPERFATKGEYVPSLLGDGKMSKSVKGSAIYMTDSLDEIKKKLNKTPTNNGLGKISDDNSSKRKKVYTDQDGEVLYGVSSLMELVEIFEGSSKREKYEQDFTSSGVRYSELKENLSKAIFTEIKTFQERRSKLENDPEYVDSVIESGARKAKEIADSTLLEVKKAMGLN